MRYTDGMSERELFMAFPAVFGGVLITGGLLFLFSRFLLIRRRVGGGTFLARRRAGERGGCLFVLAVGVLAIGVIMALGWGSVAIIFRDRLYRPIDRGDNDLYGIAIPRETLTAAVWTLTPSLTATPTATSTASPTPTSTFTATRTPIPTMTATATATPTATVPLATNTRPPVRTPLPSRTPDLTQIAG